MCKLSGNQEQRKDSETVNGAGWLTTGDLTKGGLSSSSWFEFEALRWFRQVFFFLSFCTHTYTEVQSLGMGALVTTQVEVVIHQWQI